MERNMTIVITGQSNKLVEPQKKRSGHTKPKAPEISLNEPGRLRIAHFQALLGGLSHSSFYQRLKLGRVPKPDGNDGRPYWKTETVRLFLLQ
jgi:hypothetical protein